MSTTPPSPAPIVPLDVPVEVSLVLDVEHQRLVAALATRLGLHDVADVLRGALRTTADLHVRRDALRACLGKRVPAAP